MDLPSALVVAADLEPANLSRDAARLLALELYREDRISLGRAAELSQTPLANFMDFAARHGLPPLRHDAEVLAEERSTIDRLKA